MKVAYADCPSGASGDMILGALIDAGWPVTELSATLERLGVGGYRVEPRAVARAGLAGTYLSVETDPAVRFPTLAEMLQPLERSGLPLAVRAGAAAVLRRLAEAEARVHGVPAEAVHFHELGVLDTLVDVVGSVAGLTALGVEQLHVSPLPLGHGSVLTAHGRLPLPAPATVELLRGSPIYDNGVEGELVTPTGAALLTTLGRPGPLPPMTLETVGRGAGTRELPVPNLLRLLIGAPWPGPAPGLGGGVETETLVAFETTIDDMSPQLYEPLLERLLAAGALDVYLTPVIMKRSRPGVVVSALAEPGRLPALAELVFRETTTIGVRWREVSRARLPREMVRLETSLGPVTFKVSRLGGRPVTVTPEFEEVRRQAGERGLPVREALEAACAAGRAWLADH